MRKISVVVSLAALALALVSQTAHAKKGHPQEPQILLTAAPRLAAPPASLAPGQGWDARIGIQTLASYKGFYADIRIVRLENGVTKTFSSQKVGSDFVTRVTFPGAGHWAVQVLTPNQLWTVFSSVRVGGVAPLGARESGFPVLPVVASVLAVPALLGMMTGIRRRKPGPAL